MCSNWAAPIHAFWSDKQQRRETHTKLHAALNMSVASTVQQTYPSCMLSKARVSVLSEAMEPPPVLLEKLLKYRWQVGKQAGWGVVQRVSTGRQGQAASVSTTVSTDSVEVEFHKYHLTYCQTPLCLTRSWLQLLLLLLCCCCN